MKTVSRMIFCYLLAAFGIAFLVLTVNGALLIGVVLHYGAKGQQEGFFPVGKFAESFTRTDDGFAPAPDMEWQKHFAWAMLLGDDGEILWSENLPEELNHAYTVPEVAAFSRWYLKDYPVMAYRNDFGLLVAGKEQGSMTRFDFYMDNDILYALLSGVGPLLIVDLCLVAAICLILGWRGAKPLREAAAGIGQLAEGKEVCLPQSGAAAELAEKISKYARVKLDDSDNAPGWKFSQWEMKGVPLRLEIGPKDLEKNQCVLVRRDTREKVFVSLDELETAIPAQLEALRKDLYQRALENREKRTWAATTMDEVKELAKANTGYIKTMWCGDLDCELKMKEEAGLSSRCMPFEQEHLSDVCPCCGKPAKTMVYWGIAY